MTRRTRSPRRPLERQRIVEEAVRLADDHGLDAVSMRRLATSLGVQAMSLYHHLPGKDALLAAMLDAVYERMTLPKTEGGWREALRARATATRQAFLRHPWALALVDSSSNPGPATLQHADALLGCLRSAGFSIAMTAHAVAVFDAFVYGFALQERNLPFEDGREVAAVAREILAAAPAGAYPHVRELAEAHVLRPGYAYGDEFAYGLELVLDGIERAADAERGSDG